MKKYEQLTKYIRLFENDSYGEMIIDKNGDGSIDNPLHFPYVNYSDNVNKFIADVYDFGDKHNEFDYINYLSILENNKIDKNNLNNINVSKLDAKAVFSLIVCVIRAERFCDGALLSNLENKNIIKWLKRLDELD